MSFRTLFIMAFLFIGSNVEAQLLKRLGKSAERAAERAITKKTNEKISKETEKAMDTILGNGNTTERQDTEIDSQESDQGDSSEQNKTVSIDEGQVDAGSMEVWSKYNFVPGDKIIFYDDLAGEESGEFPSRWDLLKGNAENASLSGENVINMMSKTKITPLMNEDTYLPEIFTIEFDALFKRLYNAGEHNSLHVDLWSDGQFKDYKNRCGSITITANEASMSCWDDGANKKYSSKEASMRAAVGEPVWRHVAIAFNKRSLKVFIDEKRLLNIPNLNYQPEVFAIESNNWSKSQHAIKNIRIAEGGKKLYDRVMTDGKFVTRGILFDVDKSTLKPSSMGVINEVANMMKEHTDMKFSIEGHTDSDGDDTHNLELSEQRAIAVKQSLTDAGIDGSRFEVKGLGESVPVSDNATPEDKANNRRVEFIKL